MATRMRRARSTSLAGGVKTSLASATWLGMDRPLALAAEHGRAPRLGAEAVGVGEVAERAVDRAQAIGARGDHHAGDGVVPHVAPVDLARAVLGLVGQHRVVRVDAADAGGARAGAGGVVGDAEMQRLSAAWMPCAISWTLAMPSAVSMISSKPIRFCALFAASTWVTSMSTA